MEQLPHLFEKQVIQIASLGVWHMVTGLPMKKRLEQVKDPRWEEKTGLFVTLKLQNRVRGSMGVLEPNMVLPEALFDAGQTAATHDQRFPPIRDNEIHDLEIQVTLLKDVKKIQNPEDIKLGQTGLIIARGEKQAVLLPNVAIENNWSAEQFLEACCEKAQLSHKAWKDPNTLVEGFISQVIEGGNLVRALDDLV